MADGTSLTEEDILRFAEEQRRAEEAERIRRQRLLLATSSPEAFAQYAKIARETGLPPAQVEVAPDAAKARQALQEYEQTSPDTRAWLDDPVNMGMAKDSLPTLSQLEQGLKGLAGSYGPFGPAVQYLGSRASELFWRDTAQTGMPAGVRSGIRGAVGFAKTFADITQAFGELQSIPTEYMAKYFGYENFADFQEKTNIPTDVSVLDYIANPTLFFRDVFAGDVRQLAGSVLPQSIARTGKASSEYLASVREGFVNPGEVDARNIIEKGAYAAVESFVANLPGLLAGAGAGGGAGAIAVSLTPAGLMSGGEAYTEARKEGLDPVSAALYGAGQGGIEVATELLPTKFFLDAIKVGSPFVKKITEQIITDIGGEQVATHASDALQWLVLNPEKTLSEFIAERPSAAAQTFWASVFGSALNTTLAATLSLPARMELARQQTAQKVYIDQLTALNKTASASKLLARDKDTFEDYVRTISQDAKVYVDRQTLEQQMAQNPELKEAFEQNTLLSEALQAPDSNSIVALPLAAVLSTPAVQSLKEDFRPTADSLSLREAKQEVEDFQTRAEQDFVERMQKGRRSDAERKYLTDLRRQYAQQARQSGMGDLGDNYVKAASAALVNMFATMADRMNITTPELFDRIPSLKNFQIFGYARPVELAGTPAGAPRPRVLEDAEAVARLEAEVVTALEGQPEVRPVEAVRFATDPVTKLALARNARATATPEEAAELDRLTEGVVADEAAVASRAAELAEAKTVDDIVVEGVEALDEVLGPSPDSTVNPTTLTQQIGETGVNNLQKKFERQMSVLGLLRAYIGRTKPWSALFTRYSKAERHLKSYPNATNEYLIKHFGMARRPGLPGPDGKPTKGELVAFADPAGFVVKTSPPESGSFTFQKLFDHPEVFDAYPQLKTARIVILRGADRANTFWQWNGQLKGIRLTKKFKSQGKERDVPYAIITLPDTADAVTYERQLRVALHQAIAAYEGWSVRPPEGLFNFNIPGMFELYATQIKYFESEMKKLDPNFISSSQVNIAAEAAARAEIEDRYASELSIDAPAFVNKEYEQLVEQYVQQWSQFVNVGQEQALRDFISERVYATIANRNASLVYAELVATQDMEQALSGRTQPLPPPEMPRDDAIWYRVPDPGPGLPLPGMDLEFRDVVLAEKAAWTRYLTKPTPDGLQTARRLTRFRAIIEHRNEKQASYNRVQQALSDLGLTSIATATPYLLRAQRVQVETKLQEASDGVAALFGRGQRAASAAASTVTTAAITAAGQAASGAAGAAAVTGAAATTAAKNVAGAGRAAGEAMAAAVRNVANVLDRFILAPVLDANDRAGNIFDSKPRERVLTEDEIIAKAVERWRGLEAEFRKRELEGDERLELEFLRNNLDNPYNLAAFYRVTMPETFRQEAVAADLSKAQNLLATDPAALGLTSEQVESINPIYRPGEAGLPKEKLKNGKEAARWIERYFNAPFAAIRNFKLALSSDQITHVATIMAAEAQLALLGSGHAGDWYSGALRRTIGIVSRKYPMLADEQAAIDAGFGSVSNARLVFTYILAVTSQNLTVSDNAKATLAAWDQMLERIKAGDYTMSADWGTGDKQAAMGLNFEKFGKIIKELPGETFPERLSRMDSLFREKKTVREWIKYFEANNIPYNPPGQTNTDAVVYGSSILGPKIGNGFWQNLNENFSPLTIDLWMRRTWGRLTGKSIGNPEALPAQRARLKEAVERSRSKDHGNADLIAQVDAAIEAAQRRLERLEFLPLVAGEKKSARAAEIRTVKADIDALQEARADYANIQAPEKFIPADNPARIAKVREELAAARQQLEDLEVAPIPRGQKSARKAEIKKLRADIQKLEEGTGDEALLAYSRRLVAAWNVEYKRIRAKLVEKHGPKVKVPDELQPTWARAAKTIVQNLGKPLDQVQNGTQRLQIERAGALALELLAGRGITLTMADLQAALWYPEKELWNALTAELITDEDGDPIIPPSQLNESYDTVFARFLGVDYGQLEESPRPGEGGAGAVAGPDAGLGQPEGAQGLRPVGGGDTPGAAGARTLGQERLDGRPEPPRDGGRRYSSGGLAPLEGAPVIKGATGPDPAIVAVAEQYAADNGIDLRRQARYADVDPGLATRIAAAYDAMPHAPEDPAVRAAYEDLKRQTRAQYEALVAAGYVFTFYDDDSDPYAGNPSAAVRDLRANKRMAVYGTYAGFGTEGVPDNAVETNVMLADTGLQWPDQNGVLQPVTSNDLFRAVHDAFGHSLEGAGFRARGEENAWQAHIRLYTGAARGAITSETRGQNSWLNYGPNGKQNATASVQDTVFAPNKTGLMPEWTWTEGVVEDMPAAPAVEPAPAPARKAFDFAAALEKYRAEIAESKRGAQVILDDELVQASSVLSDQQFEIFKLARDGMATKDIADAISIRNIDLGRNPISSSQVSIQLGLIREKGFDPGKRVKSMGSELTLKVVELAARGLKPKQIAEQLGYADDARKRNTITVILSRVKARYRTTLAADENELANFAANYDDDALDMYATQGLAAAVVDPETGLIYAGMGHADAIATAPPDVQARLQSAYDNEGRGSDSVGFVIKTLQGPQFFPRAAGMRELQERLMNDRFKKKGVFGQVRLPIDEARVLAAAQERFKDYVSWKPRLVDVGELLKDVGIRDDEGFGKNIEGLTDEEAERLSAAATKRGFMYVAPASALPERFTQNISSDSNGVLATEDLEVSFSELFDPFTPREDQDFFPAWELRNRADIISRLRDRLAETEMPTTLDEAFGHRLHTVRAAAFQQALDDAGVQYLMPKKAQIASEYYIIDPHDPESDADRLKVRFADHARQSGLHERADYNLNTETTEAADVRNALRAILNNPIYNPNAPKSSDLLAQAQRAGYAGQNPAEATGWLAAVAKGLDMSREARMQRAREMGFDVNLVLYHGTRADFPAFEIGDLGYHFGSIEQANRRLFQTRRDRGLEGENVLPVYLRITKSLDLPDVGDWNNPAMVAEKLLDTPWGKTKESALNDILAEAEDLSAQFADMDDWRQSPEAANLLAAIRWLIQADGYDSVRYVNVVENAGGLTAEGQQRLTALNNEYSALKTAIYARLPEFPDVSEMEPDAAREAIAAWAAAPQPKPRPEEARRLAELQAEMATVAETMTESPYSFIVFDPSNIRSIHAAFDPDQSGSANLLAQEVQLYSPLLRAIENSRQNAAPPAQWLAMLYDKDRNASKIPGVKVAELQWSSVLDWLGSEQDAGAKSITKAELLDFLSATVPRVVPVVRRNILTLNDKYERVSDAKGFLGNSLDNLYQETDDSSVEDLAGNLSFEADLVRASVRKMADLIYNNDISQIEDLKNETLGRLDSLMQLLNNNEELLLDLDPDVVKPRTVNAVIKNTFEFKAAVLEYLANIENEAAAKAELAAVETDLDRELRKIAGEEDAAARAVDAEFEEATKGPKAAFDAAMKLLQEERDKKHEELNRILNEFDFYGKLERINLEYERKFARLVEIDPDTYQESVARAEAISAARKKRNEEIDKVKAQKNDLAYARNYDKITQEYTEASVRIAEKFAQDTAEEAQKRNAKKAAVVDTFRRAKEKAEADAAQARAAIRAKYNISLPLLFPNQYKWPGGRDQVEIIATMPGQIQPWKADNLHFPEDGTTLGWVRGHTYDSPNGSIFLMDEIQTKRFVDEDAPTDAPYTGDGWSRLAIKLALKHAVESGASFIALQRGGVVAQRWKMSNFVRKISYDPATEILTSTALDGREQTTAVPPADLHRYVGVDRAKTLLATGKEATIEGKNIDIGMDAEKRRRQYDVIFKNNLAEAVKPFGGKLEEGELPDGSPVTVVRITPEMAQQVKEKGLALSQRARGEYLPITNPSPYIMMHRSMNFSTFLHEMGHLQLDIMMQLAAMPDAPADIKQDAETVLAWFRASAPRTHRAPLSTSLNQSLRRAAQRSAEERASWFDDTVRMSMDFFGTQLEFRDFPDLRVALEPQPDGSVDATFTYDDAFRRPENTRVTVDEIDTATQIMARALPAIQEWVVREKPEYLSFSGASPAHSKMYTVMLGMWRTDEYTFYRSPQPDGQDKFLLVKNGARPIPLDGFQPLPARGSAAAGGPDAGRPGDATGPGRGPLRQTLQPRPAAPRALQPNEAEAQALTGAWRRAIYYASYGFAPADVVAAVQATGASVSASSLSSIYSQRKAQLQQLLLSMDLAAAAEAMGLPEAQAQWLLTREQPTLRADEAPPPPQEEGEPTVRLPKSVEDWLSMSLEEQRPFHELFARGFEAYLLEGRAPAPELKGLYAKFADWIGRVYKEIASGQVEAAAPQEAGGLAVQLSDDVRGVMDRLAASEQEIEKAGKSRAFAAVFRSAEEAGMTKAEWDAYEKQLNEARDEAALDLQKRSIKDMRWINRLRDQIRGQRNAETNRLRREMKKAVAAELAQQPLYKAFAYLSRGIGAPEKTNFKLQRASLVERFSKALVDRLPAGPYGVVSTTGSIGVPDLDALADTFGYSSGEALLNDLADMIPLADAVEAETDARMLEQHGDLSSPEAVAMAVAEAMHGRVRMRVLATELNALLKMLGRPAELLEAVKATAQRRLGAMRVRDVKPARFVTAAESAARAAEAGLRKMPREGRKLKIDNETSIQRLNSVVDYKRAHLINARMAREAVKINAELAKARKLFDRVLKGTNEDVAKRRDINLVLAARALLAAYGQAPAARGKKATEYLALVQAYNPEIFAELNSLVAEALLSAPANPADITVQQMRNLHELVDQIYTRARNEKVVEIMGRQVEVKTAAEELISQLDELKQPKAREAGVRRPVTEKDREIRKAFTFRATLRRVESWARKLDLGKIDGPWQTYIFRPMSDAAIAYKNEVEQRVRSLVDILAPLSSDLLRGGKIDAPELDFAFNNKSELLHFLLHLGNPSNRKKLLLGYRNSRGETWGVEQEDGTVTSPSLDAFLERMHRTGVLTKLHWDTVQNIWDLMEAMKPGAQKAHKAVYGTYFSEITAAPVQTPFGTYRGGYVPAITEALVVLDKAQAREAENILADNYQTMFPTPAAGFTKGRVEDYTKPLVLDIASLISHVDAVAKFTHLAPAARQTARIIQNADVTAALNAYDPTAINEILIPFMVRTARQLNEILPSSGTERFFASLLALVRRRTSMVIMFANVVNTLQQVTGLIVAGTRVNPARILTAGFRYMANPRGYSFDVMDVSPFMRTRMRSQVYEMITQVQAISALPNRAEAMTQFFDRHTYFMQQGFQNVLDMWVWRAAYEEAIDGGADHDVAVRNADGIIRTTMGSTAPEDVSASEVVGPFGKLFGHMTGYFNGQLNALGTEMSVVWEQHGWRGAPRLGYIYFIGAFLPIFLANALALALRGQWEPTDEEEESWLLWFMNRVILPQIKFVLAGLPVIGPAVNTGINQLNDLPYDDRISTPVFGTVERALGGVADISKAVFDEDEITRQDVGDISSLISLLTGIPLAPVSRPVGYQVGVEQGDISPTSDLDYARGLVTGTPSEASKN